VVNGNSTLTGIGFTVKAMDLVYYTMTIVTLDKSLICHSVVSRGQCDPVRTTLSHGTKGVAHCLTSNLSLAERNFTQLVSMSEYLQQGDWVVDVFQPWVLPEGVTEGFPQSEGTVSGILVRVTDYHLDSFCNIAEVSA